MYCSQQKPLKLLRESNSAVGFPKNCLLKIFPEADLAISQFKAAGHRRAPNPKRDNIHINFVVNCPQNPIVHLYFQKTAS